MSQIPLRVFLLALVWTTVSAMAPVGVLLWRWISLWQDPPDWRIIGPVAITCGGIGAWGFIQKCKAQIQLPPAWAQARDLIAQMKRETTVVTEEQQKNPPAKVTTTVKETEMVPTPTATGK